MYSPINNSHSTQESFQHICADVGSAVHEFAILVEQALFLEKNTERGEILVHGNADRFVTNTLTFQNKICKSLKMGRQEIQYARGISLKDFNQHRTFKFRFTSNHNKPSPGSSQQSQDIEDEAKPHFLAKIGEIVLVGEENKKNQEDEDDIWEQEKKSI